MATSQLVKDYIGYGTHANRPATPNTGTGVAPVYYETDTTHTFVWTGSAWTQVDGGSGAFAGEVSGTDFKATGLTGAATATRLVGANSSGAPTTGTFALGDIAVDLTGKVWLCTTAGTPGTWTQIGGGSSAMTLIADTTVSGSAAATIDFSSIPGTYKHLRLIGQVRGDTAANNTALRLRMNADSTAAHYQWNYVQWYSGGTSNGAEGASDTAISTGEISASTSPANVPGTFTIDIPNYAGTVFNKTVNSLYGFSTGSGTAGNLAGNGMGYWASTAAITELTLLPGAGNFIIGSRVSLYGIN